LPATQRCGPKMAEAECTLVPEGIERVAPSIVMLWAADGGLRRLRARAPLSSFETSHRDGGAKDGGAASTFATSAARPSLRRQPPQWRQLPSAITNLAECGSDDLTWALRTFMFRDPRR
jgi:hypothetical protein